MSPFQITFLLQWWQGDICQGKIQGADKVVSVCHLMFPELGV
jgi:hypothetical protein